MQFPGTTSASPIWVGALCDQQRAVDHAQITLSPKPLLCSEAPAAHAAEYRTISGVSGPLVVAEGVKVGCSSCRGCGK